MAFGTTSGWQNTRSITVGGYAVNYQSRLNIDSINRVNNTIYVYGLNTHTRYYGSTPYYYGVAVRAYAQLPDGSNRINQEVIGTGKTTEGTIYYSSEVNFSFNVGSGTTYTNAQVGNYADGGSGWAGVFNVDIPNAGSPSFGAPSFSNLTHNSATLKGTVNSWGAYCTAGQGVRFGVWWGSKAQFYNSRTTSSYPSWNLTGLPSNTEIGADMDAINGAGIAYDGANASATTLPVSCVAGTPDIEAVSAVIPVTQDNGGGALSITKQYRLLKTGDAWGAWTTFATDIELTGLLPSTEYQVQVRSTTSSGTTTGDTTTFTTLPAAKLVMPDGTIKNAIPRVMHPDGTVKMVKVKHL